MLDRLRSRSTITAANTRPSSPAESATVHSGILDPACTDARLARRVAYVQRGVVPAMRTFRPFGDVLGRGPLRPSSIRDIQRSRGMSVVGPIPALESPIRAAPRS
jgi:hypothetical protein